MGTWFYFGGGGIWQKMHFGQLATPMFDLSSSFILMFLHMSGMKRYAYNGRYICFLFLVSETLSVSRNCILSTSPWQQIIPFFQLISPFAVTASFPNPIKSFQNIFLAAIVKPSAFFHRAFEPLIVP